MQLVWNDVVCSVISNITSW